MNTRRVTEIMIVVLAASEWSWSLRAVVAEEFSRAGSHTCLLCHTSNDTNTLLQDLGTTDFVQLNESQVWHESDLHRRTFDLIDPRPEKKGSSNQRSREMCEKLGIPVTNFGARDNAKSHECMTCHAGWDSAKFPKGILADSRQLAMGIGCESCHGKASSWLNKHHLENWVRKKEPGEKTAEGMTPLNQPHHLAKNCVSCHVGDRSVGRFVTHDMYVAGHPMLPNMEVSTFRRGMASHWRPLEQKKFNSEEEKANYLESHGLQSELRETRQLVVGALLAFQLTTRNLADGKTARPTGPARRLDFAAYDCGSCHHDLKSNSIRQTSGPREIALGRPRPHYWSKLLVDVALSGEDLEIHQKGWSNLCADLSASPFGKRDDSPDGIHQSYIDALGEISIGLARKEVTSQQALGFLEQLLSIDVSKTPDYFSAKQRADAIVTIATELKAIPTESLEPLQELFINGDVDGAVSSDLDRITKKHPSLLLDMRKFDVKAYKDQLDALMMLLQR